MRNLKNKFIMLKKEHYEKVEIIRTQLLKAFADIQFNEEEHSYMVNDLKLLSTTTFIDKLSDEFEDFSVSENKAKSWNKANPSCLIPRTGQYYRNRWDWISEQALMLGKRVHAYAETYPLFEQAYDEYEDGVINFFKWFDTRYILILQEFRVYDVENRKAGTLDIIAYDTMTDKIVIMDWKTGSTNIMQYYKHKKLKGDFAALPCTNYVKYSIQLCDYANMIEKMCPDIVIDDSYIIWLTTKDITTYDRGKSAPLYYIDKTHKPLRDVKTYKFCKCIDLKGLLKETYKKVIITDDGRTKSKLKAHLL